MQFFRNLSLTRKLSAVVLVTTGAALLLMGGLFAVHNERAYTAQVVGNLQTLAGIIGYNNSAALMFFDNAGAEESLSSLQADPHVVGAVIYDAQGSVFATYAREGLDEAFEPPEPQPTGTRYGTDHVEVFRQITENDQLVSTVYLRSDLGAVSDHMQRLAVIVLGIMLLAILMAYVISRLFQRLITAPILHLDHVAREVSEKQDYSLRATRQNDDEVGELIEVFNDMLAQIEQQDDALRSSQADLEARVDERTRELEEAREQLERRVEERTADLTSASEELAEQGRMILEMSTPVIRLWEGVLLLPLIGTFDEERAGQMIGALLEAVTETGSQVAVLDVTGVPEIDTAVARHIIRAVDAARILGAQVIVTGFSPEAAQTLGQLGVDFTTLHTRGSLKAGVREAFRKVGVHFSI